MDNFPINSKITTDVHGIGGRVETVSGIVVGHKYKMLVVATDTHGRLMVEPSKAVKMDATPVHLQDDRCFVCGGAEHAETGHKFWSNADAHAEFKIAAENAGDSWYYDPAAAYVDTYIGR